MKTALLFAGQGAQYPGMGKELYEKSAAAKKVFDDAGETIKENCFNGTKEDLMRTEVTQPCVYAVNIAAYAAFIEYASQAGVSVSPAGMAGFSLGEYAALTAAGVIDDVKKGLDIVAGRGELMMKAGCGADGKPLGGMAAALGDRQVILECVEAAREDGVLNAVNFNSPTQTVVAGDFSALERFSKAARERRVKAIPLSVGAAFHTPMMAPAAEPLKQLLLKAGLKKPACKIYCNLTGNEIPEDIAEAMADQMKSPVLWQQTIENMTADGIETFIELGPGSTLSGLVRKIAPGARTLNVEDWKSLEAAVSALAEAR
jgi:[acyl-carrier-protein] S-malonyltransferase